MLTNRLKKFRYKISLRLLLVLPFMIQIIGAVGLVGYLSFTNGKEAVNQVTQQLRREIATRIQQHLENYLETAHRINQVNHDAIAIGKLDINDLLDIGRYFTQQFHWVDEINLIAFATQAEGNYVEVLRTKDGELEISILNRKQSPNLYTYAVNDQGIPTKLLRFNINYDPRQRPWYENVVKAGQSQWSNIYLTKFEQQLVIAASKPVYDQNGNLLGVFSSNTILPQISRFLRNLKIAETGKAVIVDRKGLLIADSISPTSPVIDKQELLPNMIKATDSSNYLIRQTAQYLIKNFDNLSQINHPLQIDFKLNRDRLFVELLPFKDPRGIDWLIVIVIPESDFMGEIRKNTLITVALCIIALLVAIFIGILTANWIIKPILKLSEASQKIAQGELDQKVTVRGIKELEKLANSFNSMSEQLDISFTKVKQSLKEVSDIQYALDQAAIVVITDTQGTITYVNDKFSEISGYSQAELLGQNPRLLKSGYHSREFYQEMWETISNGQVWRGEIQNKTKNDGYYWVDTTIVPFLNEQGAAIQYLSIQTEITNRKELEQTLETKVKQRTSELAQANAEITLLNQKLEAENLYMSGKLELFREMQQMILPNPEELKAIKDLDIAGFMEPAEEVGGDYYDVLEHEGVVTIAIGDVTGHGLESSMLMVMTQTAVRTLKEARESDPVCFLDTLNRTIYHNVQRIKSDKNLTLAIINYSGGRVSISGQHEEIILVRSEGKIELIDTIDLGLPIGLDNDIAEFIDCQTVELNPGDGIVLYTDGITEARDITKEQYGIERLCQVISKNWHLSAEKIKEAVIDDLIRYIGEQKVFDDISLLLFKQN